jgi:hypothetical protein
MQTSEEGIQQTELKASPGNPFKAPQQAPAHSVYPQQYHSASIDSGVQGGEHKFESWGNFKSWMIRWRGSRRLVLVIVAIALLLDNMLLTVVGEYLNMQQVVALRLVPRLNSWKKVFLSSFLDFRFPRFFGRRR